MKREFFYIMLSFLALFIGLECGYRIARHAPPDPAVWMKITDSVDLATSRQQVGYDQGFQACQEQF